MHLSTRPSIPTPWRAISIAAMILLLPAALFAAEDSPTAFDAHSAFETLKSMEGTWVGSVETSRSEEPRETRITYRVSANGHSVIQTFGPGSDFEMFSVYHMDGDQLLMTHYCAIGNAPKMKFVETGKAGELKFEFNGGTNFDPARDAHAHEGIMRIIDGDSYRSTSIGWADGKPSLEQNFTMKRVD